MKKKNLLKSFVATFLLFVAFSAQSQTTDYGTFTVNQNPKMQEVFTNTKFEEIRAEIEVRRKDDIEVVWQITEYTYILIKPRNTAQQTNTEKQ